MEFVDNIGSADLNMLTVSQQANMENAPNYSQPPNIVSLTTESQALSPGPMGLNLMDMSMFEDYLMVQPTSPHCRGQLLDDDGYSKAKVKLSSFMLSQNVSDFWFPSKFMSIRFLRAFFEHMAPHIPIVHEASFDAATTKRKCSFSHQRPTQANSRTSPASTRDDGMWGDLLTRIRCWNKAARDDGIADRGGG